MYYCVLSRQWGKLLNFKLLDESYNGDNLGNLDNNKFL